MKLLKQQQIQIQIVNISEYFRSHLNYILPKLFVMVFFLLVLLLTMICLTFFSVYFGRSWCRLLFLRIFSHLITDVQECSIDTSKPCHCLPDFWSQCRKPVLWKLTCSNIRWHGFTISHVIWTWKKCGPVRKVEGIGLIFFMISRFIMNKNHNYLGSKINWKSQKSTFPDQIQTIY